MTKTEAEHRIDELLGECAGLAEQHKIHFIAAASQTVNENDHVLLVACGADAESSPKEICWAYSMLGYEHPAGAELVCEATSRMVQRTCKERQSTRGKGDLLAALERLKEILGAAETA